MRDKMLKLLEEVANATGTEYSLVPQKTSGQYSVLRKEMVDATQGYGNKGTLTINLDGSLTFNPTNIYGVISTATLEQIFSHSVAAKINAIVPNSIPNSSKVEPTSGYSFTFSQGCSQ